MSNFCTQCGKPNAASSKFCFDCGSPLVSPSVMETPRAPNPEAPTPLRPPPNEFLAQPNVETAKITADVLKLTGVGGWLRFLVVVLMVIGPLISLGALGTLSGELDPLVTEYPAFGQLRNMVTVFTVLSVVWSVFVGYRLAKGYHNAPSLAKWFFILAPVFFIVQAFLMLTVTGLPQVAVDAMAGGLVLEFFKSLVSSLIWYLYLVRSKRVRYTYPDPKSHVRCPECRKFVFSKSAACPHCKTKLQPL